MRLPRSLQKEQRSSEDRERLLVVSNSSVIIAIALAKYKGLIPNAKLVADRLIEGSFWISRRILEKFLRELGEL